MIQTNVHWLVHGFVIIFMLAMLAIGFFSSKKIHNYQASVVGGLASFLAYLLVTFMRYSSIQSVKLASELPKQ